MIKPVIIQAVVYRCQIVFSENIVAEIAAGNRSQLVDIVDMVNADKGHLLVEMTPLDFAADHVPKVGIGSFSKQTPGIELRNDGEFFVVGGNVALDAKTDIVCSV